MQIEMTVRHVSVNAELQERARAKAAALLEESLALFEALGDVSSMSNMLNDLGVVARRRGELADAVKGVGETMCRQIAVLEQATDRKLDMLRESVEHRLEAIQQDIDRRGFSTVVVPETMRTRGGNHFGGDEPEYVDSFGHPYFPSTGSAMTSRIGTSSRSSRGTLTACFT